MLNRIIHTLYRRRQSLVIDENIFDVPFIEAPDSDRKRQKSLNKGSLDLPEFQQEF